MTIKENSHQIKNNRNCK